jgi:hypothetical protein
MRPARQLSPARPIAAALALAAVTAGAARAQDGAPDARWQAWYGCWSAAPDTAVDGPGAALVGPPAGAGAVACVTPAGAAGVEVTSVAGGRVVGRDRLDASGARRAFQREGCAGWERGEWSADGRRVYLRSEMTCANNVRRTGDGVLAFTRGGEWLDVRAASVNGYTGVRTRRYRPAAAPAGLPTDVAAALEGRGLGVETARASASVPASSADVVEVTTRAGAPVAAAWAAELGQRFDVSARQLAALADGGVPGSVTDVLVATAYPERFALGPSGAERTLRERRDASDDGSRTGPVAMMTPGFGGWGWDGLSPLGFSPFGLNAWNTGFIPGLGFVPRGGFWGAGPVVVARPSAPASGERGRVVPGRGYTGGDGASSGSARPAGGGPSASPAVSRGGYSGGSSSGAARSGGSSSGSSSSGGGRTAKPRP